MNRRQRMKNRETARGLRQWVNAPTISIGSCVGVDPGAPGGDWSAVAFVEVGRALTIRLHRGTKPASLWSARSDLPLTAEIPFFGSPLNIEDGAAS